MELAQGTSHSHDALLATEAKLVRFAFGHFGREGGGGQTFLLPLHQPAMNSYQTVLHPSTTVHMYSVHVQNYVFENCSLRFLGQIYVF
jgi:hypothetical protein